MNSTPSALIVATMDTKGQEALYIAECLEKEGVSVCLMDAGIKGQSPAAGNVTREEVARAGGGTFRCPLLPHSIPCAMRSATWIAAASTGKRLARWGW